jgi:hypothetical protein
MHTRETIRVGRPRSAIMAGKLAIWLGIALLLAAPLPAMPSALGLAAASAQRPVRAGMPAGEASRLHSRAHPSTQRARTTAGGMNLAASMAITSTLSGQVVDPAGQPFFSASSPNPAAGISAISFDGSYNFTNLNADGTFSIALETGIYELSVWLDSATYPSLSGPEPFNVSVSGATPIGDIALVGRDVTISGTVTVISAPAIGVPISAWDAQGRQFSTTTNTSGQYTLTITPGEWEISPDLLDTTSYIFAGSPETGQFTSGQSATINFSVEQAIGTITGSIVNQNTSAPVTNIEGWAYVTRNDGQALKLAPISNGSFSMPAPHLNTPSDVLRVGLYLDPGSNYSSPGETTLNNATAPNFTVNIPVQPHSATIAGHVYMAEDTNHTAITQVDGQVILTALDDGTSTPLTKSVPIDPATGRYSVNVLPGDWLVTYQLDSDLYQVDLSTPLSVTAGAQQISILDLPLTSLDGLITAEVRDQDGVLQPNVTVWARYGSQEIYAETDSQGIVTLYVPYSSLGRAVGQISPQGQQQPPLTIGTSYSNCKKPVKPVKPPPSNIKCKNNSPVLIKAPTPKPKPRGLDAAIGVDTPVVLGLRDTNTTLAGRVLTAGGLNARADAFVSAWSTNGQWISASTDSNGAFSLPIMQDSIISATWQISASYWDSSANRLFNKRVAVTVPAGSASATPIAAGDLTLEQVISALPPAESQSFNNSDGLTLTLADGTLIQIPQNAMPDGFGQAIRITVDPQIELPSTDLNRLAVYYGYTINLYDAQTGKPITQPLKQPATITFSYTPALLQQLGLSEESLQPAQFADDAWHVAQGFLQDTQGDVKTISFETTSLDTWALVAEQRVLAQAGGARVYVPMVMR